MTQEEEYAVQDLPFTLSALRSAYADGAKPEDVVREVFRRIAAVGDDGVFLHLPDIEAVLSEARALGAYDPSKPLWGAPFVVKDNIDVAGWPTTAGCEAYRYDPPADSFVVKQLRAAGALCIGKTNLDQFATGLVGVRTPGQAPKNAVDPAIVPGGSSSGSAVAVAHGMVAFSLGTDTAGSGRVPAGLNNIVGLKPTLGALSASGVVPACRTLDTISIFALTVDDAYAVHQAAAQYDAEDAYAREIRTPPAGAAPPELTIGVPTPETLEFFGDEAQRASFAATLEALRAQGRKIKEIDFQPFYAVAEMLYEGAWVAERHSVIEELLARDPEAVHPTTRKIVGAATKLSATDAFRGVYRLEALRRQVEPVLSSVDLLCVPTFPTFVSCAEIEADPIGPNSGLGVYTNFVNLLGMCGLAAPTAPRSDGRPGGATLLARAGADGLLASVGRELEQLGERRLGATGWAVPALKKLPPIVLDDEIQIAVCGAHMSGLPLNKELTERGGRFLRAGRSAPCYKLYALPGGPPLRPGMVRVAPEEGGAIALEIWALPLREVGGFLAGVPSPLGLGAVQLSDGETVTGFVCEQAGVAGAEDVTALGDWRVVLREKGLAP